MVPLSLCMGGSHAPGSLQKYFHRLFMRGPAIHWSQNPENVIYPLTASVVDLELSSLLGSC